MNATGNTLTWNRQITKQIWRQLFRKTYFVQMSRIHSTKKWKKTQKCQHDSRRIVWMRVTDCGLCRSLKCEGISYGFWQWVLMAGQSTHLEAKCNCLIISGGRCGRMEPLSLVSSRGASHWRRQTKEKSHWKRIWRCGSPGLREMKRFTWNRIHWMSVVMQRQKWFIKRRAKIMSHWSKCHFSSRYGFFSS